MDLGLDFHSFVEELTKTIDEFDGQIVEFVLDPKSAEFVLKLRRIISKAFHGESNSKSKPIENSFISNAGGKQNPGKEVEQVEDEKRQKYGQNVSEKRVQELEKADQHLRSFEVEAAGGFYTLHKCLLCKQDFNRKAAARCHVFRVHFNIKLYCPVCGSYFFNQESLHRHTSKCDRGGKGKINVKSSFGEKMVKVRVYSQSKQTKSPGFSLDSNKTDESFDPQNPNDNSNVNITVRNPFDGFSLKKATSVKIKLDRLKPNENKNVVEKPSNPKDIEQNEDEENKTSEFMENTKKKAKVAPSQNQSAKPEKSRIFDVEGAQLVCGIERNFFV